MGTCENVRTVEKQGEGLIEEYLCYLGEKKNRSALTLDSYENDLNQFAVFLADRDRGILNVDAQLGERFVEFLNGHYSPSTISRKTTVIRGFYRFLKTAGKIGTNPFYNINIRPVESGSLDFLKEAHLQKLFDIISGHNWLALRDRAIVAILYSTGMRVGELVDITINDIDLENATIQISAAGKVTRLCGLPGWACHTLRRYIDCRGLNASTDPKTRSILFVNRDGGALTARSIRRRLAEYSRRAELPVEATPAVLRHSCAMHMLQNGADARDVRNLLGHLSASSMRPYLNRLSEIQDEILSVPESIEISAS